MGVMPTEVVQQAFEAWLKECSRYTAEQALAEDAKWQHVPEYVGETAVGVMGLAPVDVRFLVLRLKTPLAPRFREYAHLRGIRLAAVVEDGDCTVFACQNWDETEAKLWALRMKTLTPKE